MFPSCIGLFFRKKNGFFFYKQEIQTFCHNQTSSTFISGLSGDKFKFDSNGDGPARYNIIHFKEMERGVYEWVRVGEYVEGELRLNLSGKFL